MYDLCLLHFILRRRKVEDMGCFTLTQISDYLQRLNLYRQRVWSCKVTGKTGLTYEEAIVSEQRATEKFLQFPKEFMTPALKIIQYSKSYSRLS